MPASSSTTSTMSSFTVIMNTQSRYRRILQSSQNGGQDCPNLIDVRPCPLQSSHSCTNRFWKPREWSRCILPDGKTCGEGLRVSWARLHFRRSKSRSVRMLKRSVRDLKTNSGTAWALFGELWKLVHHRTMVGMDRVFQWMSKQEVQVKTISSANLKIG